VEQGTGKRLADLAESRDARVRSPLRESMLPFPRAEGDAMEHLRHPVSPQRLVVVLIKPSKYDDFGYVIRYRKGFLPSNTLACLAALTDEVRRKETLGAGLEWRIELLDDTVQDIPVAAIGRRGRRAGTRMVVGLVGVQTNQFPRAADLALAFRRQGIDVLIGGFHVSGSLAMFASIPPEIQRLLDGGVSIVAGEVEGRWGDILADVLHGKIHPVYNFLAEPPELCGQPIPKADRRYLRHFLTSNFGTIDAGRGCPFRCSFCTIINVQGRRMRSRDVESLIAGIRENYRTSRVSFYFITDDNFARNPWWEEILDGLIRLREAEQIPLEFMMQVDTLAYRLENFVRKSRQAGCSQVFIGMESLNPRNLAAAGKDQNNVDDLANLVTAFHDEGIMTHAAYIIGFPFDTSASVRDDITRLKRKLGVKQASFFMLTPLAGSRDHQELVNRKVPLDPDLNRYDAFHPTFTHSRMTEEEWTGAYQDAWRSFYSFENMRDILEATPPDRYWNVFKNFIWAKSAVFIECQHPMISGYFRRMDRRSRRPGFARESWWGNRKRRLAESRRKAAAWIALLLEMEELWLQTRKMSERERVLWEEIQRIRHDAQEWRQLHAGQLQQAYRRASERLNRLSPSGGAMLPVPSYVTLYLRSRNVFSAKILQSRAALSQFWGQMRVDFCRGRLYRMHPIKMAIYLVRDLALMIRFTMAMFSSGVR
jgi:radical SAM superfamily enzyme YgiQ (UPF0313 family)